MRVFIDLRRQPLQYRYLDSVHAALVAALTESGLESREVVGEMAQNWCFAAKGYSKSKGPCVLTGVTISAASEKIAAALTRLNPQAARVSSVNGDQLDLSCGVLRAVPDRLCAGTDDAMFAFASPFVLVHKKDGVSSKTSYVGSLDEVDIDAALRSGLERRAGRPLDISFHIDRLSLRADGRPRVVRYRRMAHRRDQMIDAFSLPVSVRGEPEAVRFAYLAGLGAKTRVGFGCPVLPR